MLPTGNMCSVPLRAQTIAIVPVRGGGLSDGSSGHIRGEAAATNWIDLPVYYMVQPVVKSNSSQSESHVDTISVILASVARNANNLAS